jgi:hypothetical protein
MYEFKVKFDFTIFMLCELDQKNLDDISIYHILKIDAIANHIAIF